MVRFQFLLRNSTKPSTTWLYNIFISYCYNNIVPEPETETVELIKPEQRGLGLMIIEDK